MRCHSLSRELAAFPFQKPLESEHQGTAVNSDVNFENIECMDLNLLVKEGADVRIEVSPENLEIFAESVAQHTIMAYNRELEGKDNLKKSYTWSPLRCAAC